jgi:hypothetical protein
MAFKSVGDLLSSKGKKKVGPSFTKAEIGFILKEHEKHVQKLRRERRTRAKELLKEKAGSPEIAKRFFVETRIPERFPRPGQLVFLGEPPVGSEIVWSTRTRSFDEGSAPQIEQVSRPRYQSAFRWRGEAFPAVGGLAVEVAIGNSYDVGSGFPAFPGFPSGVPLLDEEVHVEAAICKNFSLSRDLLPAVFCATIHVDIGVGGLGDNRTAPCGQDPIGWIGGFPYPYWTSNASAVLGNIFSSIHFPLGISPAVVGGGHTFLVKEGDAPLANIDDRSFDVTAPSVFIPPTIPNAADPLFLITVAVSANAEAFTSSAGPPPPPAGLGSFAAMDYTGDFPGRSWPYPLEPLGYLWYGKICVELRAWLYKLPGGIANLPPASL